MDGLGDVVEGAESSGGDGGWVGKVNTVFQKAGGDHVDGDAVAGLALGEGAGENPDSGFSDMITCGQIAGSGPVATGIAEIDNASGGGLAEEGEKNTGSQERGGGGGVEACEPIFRGEVGEGLADVDAGVVDEKVETSREFADGGGEFFGLIRLGEIGEDNGSFLVFRSNGFGNFFGTVFVPVCVNDDVVACLREGEGEMGAEARA